MRRSLSHGIAALFLSLPMAVAASSGSVLSDIEAIQGVLHSQQAEALIDAAEDALESRDELLPTAAGAASSAASSADGMLSIAVDGKRVPLRDVPVDAWFAPYVESAAQDGIISGYRDGAGAPLGLFGPGDAVTVEQLAKMAVLASQMETDRCDGEPRNPTARGRWSAQVIACAESRGWSLFSDGGVRVTRPATRAEVVATLLQAFGIVPGKTSGDAFSDVNVTTVFAAYIERASADEIVGGYTDAAGKTTGKFGPTNPVNRAEIAKMLTLVLERYAGR